MDTRPVCCQPCEVREMCRPKRNCCIECHISYEEEVALPYLPPPLRARLIDEHQRLDALGYPKDELDAHSRWEERVFRLYCPESICKQIEDDHVAYDAGALVSRETVAPKRMMNPDPGALRMRRVLGSIRPKLGSLTR